MPILRREDAPDPLAPQLLLLWHRKWMIIGIGLAAAVLTYIVLLFVSSSYTVKSEIFVNRLPAIPEGETPNPDTVSTLLKSQSLLENVRNDFAKKFDIHAPKIEDFVKSFKVESTVLQDTTVRKELSPVLELQVESKGADETRFIMESWIRHFIAEFGNYTVDEAIVKRDAYLKEKDRLEKEMSEVSRRQAEVEANLPYVRKILAEKLDQLSPARLRLNPSDRDGQQNNIQFIVQTPRYMPGLMERQAEAQLELRKGSTTASAELAALQSAIADTTTSVTEAQEIYAQALFEEAQLERQMNLLTETRKSINNAITRFTVAAAVYHQDPKAALPAGGDIRALSMPVTPETRSWPKRTLAAAAAAVVASILAALVLLGNQYITRLEKRDIA